MPPDAAGGWLDLLSSLSDDELTRYGEIARDQLDLEWRYAWAQGLVAAAAAGVGVLAVRDMALAGIGRDNVMAFGLAGALGYWPYRKALVRRLWTGHCKAVASELAQRRGGAAGGTEAGAVPARTANQSAKHNGGDKAEP